MDGNGWNEWRERGAKGGKNDQRRAGMQRREWSEGKVGLGLGWTGPIFSDYIHAYTATSTEYPEGRLGWDWGDKTGNNLATEERLASRSNLLVLYQSYDQPALHMQRRLTLHVRSTHKGVGSGDKSFPRLYSLETLDWNHPLSVCTHAMEPAGAPTIFLSKYKLPLQRRQPLLLVRTLPQKHGWFFTPDSTNSRPSSAKSGVGLGSGETGAPVPRVRDKAKG